MIVNKYIKAYNREANNNTSHDFYEVLEEKIKLLLDDANKRATCNGRKTVTGKDL